ncbi:MAG: zinc metallopeptidase, partial [Clostridia bacterium]
LLQMSSWIYVGIAALALFVIVGLAIATYSGAQFLEIFDKFDDVGASSYLSVEKFAILVNNEKFGGNVKLAIIRGKLTDAYEKERKLVAISEHSLKRSSVASLCVVAHEFGHAMQDAENNKKFNRILKMKKAVNYLGIFVFPLIIIGIILCIFLPNYLILGIGIACLGLAIFLTALLIKVAILPVEKDASKRGIMLLREFDVLNEEEIKIATKVLSAAYLTYVGDFFRAILGWTFLTGKTKFF